MEGREGRKEGQRECIDRNKDKDNVRRSEERKRKKYQRKCVLFLCEAVSGGNGEICSLHVTVLFFARLFVSFSVSFCLWRFLSYTSTYTYAVVQKYSLCCFICLFFYSTINTHTHAHMQETRRLSQSSPSPSLILLLLPSLPFPPPRSLPSTSFPPSLPSS